MPTGVSRVAPPATPTVSRGVLPRRAILVARQPDDARALAALLCDAEVACRSLEAFDLDAIEESGCEGVVVFGRELDGANLLTAATSLRALRPSLPLVLVTKEAARMALFEAFEGATMPPVILGETAPAAVIRDALRVAWEAARLDGTRRPTLPSALPDWGHDPAAPIVQMYTGRAPTSEHCFDRFLPAALRQASPQYWTPIDAILRAAAWFDELGIERVVDIGSGVGKFCIVAAVASKCTFIGVEQRPKLVGVARSLAQTFGVQARVSFIDGSFGEVPIPPADCYYLFNPFEENLLPPVEALDTTVELNPDRFRRDLRAFRAFIASLPVGARVLTLNGVGGRLPDCLDERRVDRELPTVLRLLEKVRN